MSDQNKLPRPARLLILATIVLGAAGIGIRLPEIGGWTSHDILVWGALVLAIALTEQFSIPLRHRTETVNFSLTDALWVPALLLARPSVLTFAVTAGVLVGQVVRRWSPYKIAFNVGQFVIGITVAEAAFTAMGPGDPLEPATWMRAAAAMSGYFVLNASLVVWVVSLVERKPFLQILLPPLGLNVLHWAGNMALGILGAVVWTVNPAGLPLLALPVVLSFLAYRQWVSTVRQRDQMRDMYEAGRALAGPIGADDFRPFLSLLEQMLEAHSVELVVLDGDRMTVHGSGGTRSFTATSGSDGTSPPLEAFVRVQSGLAPQVALIGGPDEVKGVVALYRREPLNAFERSLLDMLASQISVQLQNHRLFFETFEQAQLADIVAHTSDGVFVVGHDRRILSWNPAMERITGFGQQEVLGQASEEILGSTRYAAGETHDSLVTRKDGGRRWIRHTGSPIRDREGAPKSCVVVARDVTAELQAEQLKKDFVAMVSHELRTPLTPLKGFLGSLLEGTTDDSPEARQEYYRIMLRQTDRLERLITDLLEVSQIESGELSVQMQPVELTELVGEQVREFSESHRDRTIRLQHPEQPLLVQADPFRVRQVLDNLITNAIKYTPPNASIEVSAVAIGEEAVVSVRDGGPGISLEEQDRVFDRFYRVENGSDRATGGTGLGLYIARRLVDAMSGRLWLVSRPGDGSTFSFSLARADILRLVKDREHAGPERQGAIL